MLLLLLRVLLWVMMHSRWGVVWRRGISSRTTGLKHRRALQLGSARAGVLGSRSPGTGSRGLVVPGGVVRTGSGGRPDVPGMFYVIGSIGIGGWSEARCGDGRKLRTRVRRRVCSGPDAS